MNSLSLLLIASGMKLLIRSSKHKEPDTPSPTPDKLVESMTVIACLKLLYKHNDDCSEHSIVCSSIHSPYFDDIDLPNTCYGSMATRVFALELWWIYSLICVKIMTEVVVQSCRTVYDTIIIIIHSANSNRASNSSLSCCVLTLLPFSLSPLLV